MFINQPSSFPLCSSLRRSETSKRSNGFQIESEEPREDRVLVRIEDVTVNWQTAEALNGRR